LIESGSARKPVSPADRHLLYVICEIALIVIRVLIALQVNNTPSAINNIQEAT